MLRLKLPRVADDVASGLPPELRWDAPHETVALLMSRREFVKAVALVLAVAAAPFTQLRQAAAKARGRFFTAHERTTLEALCDRILPADRDPGAKALGAVRYIEGMLTAFDRRVPRIFAGGPFSGRTPFPDNDTGTASKRRPADDFRHFISPSRLQELRWRAELFGSAKVPGAAFNDAALGPLAGLRHVYRSGLAKVDMVARKMAHAPFVELPPAKQDEVLKALPAAFQPDRRRDGLRFTDLLTQRTLEGCFAAPEYGGNKRARGWRLMGLEGDAHPLGYSIFSRATNGYVERPDHPVSTPNPDELAGGILQPRALTPDGERIQQGIISLATFVGLDC